MNGISQNFFPQKTILLKKLINFLKKKNPSFHGPPKLEAPTAVAISLHQRHFFFPKRRDFSGKIHAHVHFP
jgi:hypothetical protein